MPDGSPSSPAVFLDRDGTLVEDPGYLRDPAGVRLLPGVGPAIARLNGAGVPAIVVTNQSGIGRGLLTEADYHSVRRRIGELLAAEGARIDGEFFCPHWPETSGPCDCRKPNTLLFRQAAERFGLDLRRSWWIGDRMRDIEPARALGGQGILVVTGEGLRDRAAAEAAGFTVAADLATAVGIVLPTVG